MPRRPSYSTMYERLVANTAEPSNAQACWMWTGKRRHGKSHGWGYGGVNVRVPGLGVIKTFCAHVVMWLLINERPGSANDLFLFMHELRCSGLEIDHLCHNTGCIFPDHLDGPITKSENNKRRYSDRWRDREPTQCTYSP